MKKVVLHTFFAICLLSLLYGCNEHTVYHSFQSLSKDGWKKSDTLFFYVDVPDSLEHYDLNIQVRNRSDYPYQNLSLTIVHNLQDTCCWKKENLTCRLTNEDGQWSGNGWGAFFQNSYDLSQLVTLQSGIHTIKIAHGMKDSILIGVSDVGVRIDRY